jgi:hypothetical protein
MIPAKAFLILLATCFLWLVLCVNADHVRVAGQGRRLKDDDSVAFALKTPIDSIVMKPKQKTITQKQKMMKKKKKKKKKKKMMKKKKKKKRLSMNSPSVHPSNHPITLRVILL